MGCLPRGSACLPRGMSAQGGGGMSAQGGVCPGGVCPEGVCPGGCLLQCMCKVYSYHLHDVGSGDPVRVLRLYTTSMLDTL